MLPEETVEEIMVRLPVKTLLRFRCISKSLWSLIDSPYFINKHLEKSIKTNTHKKLIIPEYKLEKLDYLDRRILVGFESKDIIGGEVEEKPIKLIRNPIKCPDRHCGFGRNCIKASCNGLLVLKLDNINSNSLLVWNPFTNRSKILFLPKHDNIFKYAFFYSYGFGYDSDNDDYKIVIINLHVLGYDKAEVAVYSLRSNSWRLLIYDLPLDEGDKMTNRPGLEGKPANGALHWLCKKQSNDLIFVVAFDFITEKFCTLPTPAHCCKDIKELHVFEERLHFSTKSMDFYALSINNNQVTWSKSEIIPSSIRDLEKATGGSLCWESLVSLGDDAHIVPPV